MRILSVLFLINILLGLFLILILMINSKKKVTENLFLSILLLIITGYQVKAIIVLEGHYESFPFLIGFFLPLHFLLGPLFFYYVKFSIDKKIQLTKKDSIHLLPSLLCFITLLPLYLKTSSEKLAIYNAPSPDHFEIASSKIFYYAPILLLAIFYCWKSLTFVRSKKKLIDGRVDKTYSSKIKWLEKYSQIFLFFLFFFLVSQIIFVFTDFHQFYVMLSVVYISSIMMHYVTYWSLKESRATNSIAVKNEPSELLQKRIPELKQKIIHLLENERIYLDNKLNTQLFCEQLQINSQYLSQVVNSEFNCNLSYLINSYRVGFAKEIIKSGEFNHLNFLGIANKVGFKSANTFTRVFKQHTGETPSHYKKTV